ncbi:MAG: class I SAM-dependent methyltransferase [bacterium]
MDKEISNQAWRQKILSKFEKLASDSKEQKGNFMGYRITVLEGVFSPFDFPSTAICVENLPEIVGPDVESFLEIGAGCGVNTLAVALNSGNLNFLCTDINPKAVANTNLNLANHNLPQKCILSDVFDEVNPDLKYQVIFWNPPFNNVFAKSDIASDMLLKAGFDPDYAALRKFFEQVKSRLTVNGKVILCTSRVVGDLLLIKLIAKQNGFKEPKILAEQVNQGMDLCLVEFKL